MGQTRSYNDDGTLASISYSGAAIGDLTYTWDANQNKTSETIGGVMSGYGFTASYDAEDRLIGWGRSDASLDQSWDLSPVGDWNSITQNASVQNRTHGPAHEILTAASQSVQHDVKGNMTLIPPVLRPGSDPLKLKWGFDNKLRAADTDDDGSDDVFYRWDALGRRVGRDDGTTSVVYVHDGQQTISDYVAGTAASSPTYNYVYASYIDEPIVRGGSGGIRYFHRNGQYSITALTDGGGSIIERYAYTAYGQATITNASGTMRTASTNNNRYTYTGREWDEGLSLYHYRARMYDPVAGRFASRDPIGYADGFNRYLFLRSAPLMYMDSLGLATELPEPLDSGAGGEMSNCVRLQRKISIQLPKSTTPIAPFIFASAGGKAEIDLSTTQCNVMCNCESPAPCEYREIAARARFGAYVSLTGGYDGSIGVPGTSIQLSGYLGVRGEYWAHLGVSGRAHNDPCVSKCDLACPNVCGNLGGRLRISGGGMMKFQPTRFWSWDIGVQIYGQASLKINACVNVCSGEVTMDYPFFSGVEVFAEGCVGGCFRYQLY